MSIISPERSENQLNDVLKSIKHDFKSQHGAEPPNDQLSEYINQLIQKKMITQIEASLTDMRIGDLLKLSKLLE